MKNLRGVCAAGWGEPCPASAGCDRREHEPRQRTGERRILSPTSCGFLLERLISWYLSCSAKSAPRTGARSPSGNSRGGCRGCIPLDPTQCDMMNEGTEYFGFWVSRIPLYESSTPFGRSTVSKGLVLGSQSQAHPKPPRVEFNPAEFKKILAEVLRIHFSQKSLSQNRVRFYIWHFS